jgi:hypothetical protein
VVIVRRELLVRRGENPVRGYNIQDGELCDPLGTIQRHPVRDTAAPVVPDNSERIEPQPSHDLDLIRCHGALGVTGMVCTTVGLRAVAVASQIRRDDGKGFGEEGATKCHIARVWG